ncbi:MAG: LysE family transporter [Anaerolineae bacterium]|nr:LysE family transporter [Thermoflexales bacterium]MDW8406757.1 LysE family transporter [Anaerolineae bacterium]
MWLFSLQGATLGFSAAASPGPFQAYLLSQALHLGWRRAWPAAFAPLLSDGPIILLMTLVLTQAPPDLLRALQIAGGLFLLYLAFGAVQRVRAAQTTAPVSVQNGLMRAVATNLLSPGPWIFWSTVGGPILARAWAESPAHSALFLLGFYGAMVSVLLALIALFAASARMGPAFTRALGFLSALALAAFGLYQIIAGWLR